MIGRFKAALRRTPPDLILLLAVLLLLVIGVIAVTSAGAPESLKMTQGQNAFYIGLRQLIYMLVGVGILFFMMKFPYHNLKRITVFTAVATLVLLVLVLFLGNSIKGAKRWIELGIISLQPSEVAKISIILAIAYYLSEINKGVQKLFPGVFLPLVFVGLNCLLILLEPDLGTTIVIFATFMFILFAAGTRLSHLGALFMMGVSGATALVVLEPYRLKRLLAFLDPWKDPKGDGWQIIQSLYALGSGGPFGMGLGMGRQKFDYLPEAHTDYIFSIIGEELGFLGTITVIFLFIIIAWRGYKIAVQAKDTYGQLLAAGITSIITFQALLNIGVVTSSIPVTGLTLPFLSFGGSSLLVSTFLMGIILNISKNT